MEAVFIKLFNMSITATWIALAVILIRLLFKKAPKHFRVFMWGLVGLRLLIPFSIESVLSLIPSAETVPPDIIYSDKPYIQSGIPIINSTFNPIISESLAPATGDSVNPMQVVGAVAANIWIFGMTLMALYAVISYMRIRLKVKEAARVDGIIWECDNIDTPFILGIVRPRIYLPSSLTAEDREYVIAHERAHLKRRDHFWKPLGFLLLTVYWFNPVLWAAYVLLCKDIELATDEKVIKALGEEIKKPYSEALINCSVPRKAISACPVAFGESSIKERVKAVLNYKKASFWIIIIAVISCVGLGVLFLTNPVTDDGKNDNSVTNVGGVDPPENVTVIPSEIKIEKLKERYPEYFDLNPTTKVAVFAWKTAPDKYSFGVARRGYAFRSGLPSYNYFCFGDKAFEYLNDEEMKAAINKISAILPPLTLEETHAILAYCMVPTEYVTLIPIQDPTGGYGYEVTNDYREKTDMYFWDGLRVHISAPNIEFELPCATVKIASVMPKGNSGAVLGLVWNIQKGFTEATKTEYPKYHVKITVGNKSKFTFLPLPNEWHGDEESSFLSTYEIDLPTKGGDDITFDLYLNDDKTFVSNVFKIIPEDNSPEIPEADFGYPSSYTDFDIDGDGKTERIRLGAGYTSGLYTFTMRISDTAGDILKDYYNTFMATGYAPKRLYTANGKCFLECAPLPTGDGSSRYYTVEVKDGNIVLRYGEETFGYWGKQGAD
ncbi:MAG: hypothetical protein IJC49_05055 [Clostridia bacterium]|nr:hypothetical protein [Clostridia bacterium]